MATEAIKVQLTAGVTNAESVVLTGVSGHAYAVLSVLICETAGAAETFDMYVDDNAGGTDYYVYKTQALGANATFEHTSKFVLEGTDRLCIALASAGNVDVVVSFLDQTL
jgi:hypothetical protein|tara:strand:+ start:43 stop:372 length:330 start_codon:yes stop_codon:yes gene_type:complete